MNEFDFLALQVNRILELPRKWIYAGKETIAKIKQKGKKKKQIEMDYFHVRVDELIIDKTIAFLISWNYLWVPVLVSFFFTWFGQSQYVLFVFTSQQILDLGLL